MSSATSTNGSTVTYTYNPDGSYVETVVSTDAHGAATTTVYSVDALGQLLTEDVRNPDGSTGHREYSYLTNGGYQQVIESSLKLDGSGSSTTYLYNPDGSLQQKSSHSFAGDGSHTDTTINYNPDGSYQETVDATAANGQVMTTTNTIVNAQGQLLDKVVTTATGTDHTQYSYPSNGLFLGEVLEDVVNSDGSRSNVRTEYNPDGTVFQVQSDTLAPDGSHVSSGILYNPDRSYNTVVATFTATGQMTSTTNTTFNALGQALDKFVSTSHGTDHTQYQYSWNGGLQQVTENVVNDDGSRSDATTSYNGDGTYARIVKDAIATDGSRVDTEISYNQDQSYQETVRISTASGQVTSTTTTTVNSLGQLVAKLVSTPAGTDNTFYQYTPQGTHQQITENVLNADGSRVDTTINYNWDQSYHQAVTATAVNGQVTATTDSFFNAQGQLTSKDVSTPAGTDHTEYQYFANGTVQRVTEYVSNPVGPSSTITSYNPNGSYAQKDVMAADGSGVHTTFTYNTDESYQETATATSANGQVTSTTNSSFNAQGQLISQDVSAPAGTEHTRDQYFANGSNQQVTEDVFNADGSRVDTAISYRPDGAYVETVTSFDANGQQIAQNTSTVSVSGATYTNNPDGSYVDTVVATDAQGIVTTTVYSVDAQGQLLTEDVTKPDGSRIDTTYSYSPDGSVLQKVSNAVSMDGSGVNTTVNYYAGGGYQKTDTATAANGQVTSTTNSFFDVQGQLAEKSVTTANGTDDTQYQYLPDGSGYQQVQEHVANADGSRIDTTTNYNPDGSYQQTVNAFGPTIGVTTTTTGVDAQGRVIDKFVSTANGTDHTQYLYLPQGGGYSVAENVINRDGSHSVVETDYNANGTYNRIVKDSTAADGSWTHAMSLYNPDQSYQETVTATAANGQVTSTTNTSVDARGRVLDNMVSTPLGTDHTQNQYFWDGSYLVTESIDNVDGSHTNVSTGYNPNGTYQAIDKDAFAADGSQVDMRFMYNPDQSYQETVTATAANGQMTSTTNTRTDAQGRVLDNLVSTPTGTDHTQNQYFGDGSRQVTENVANTDGSSSDMTARYYSDGYAQITKDAIAADGSRLDTLINYGTDQSHQETDTATAANGQVTSTTSSAFNAQGELLSKGVSTSAGTDNTQYQYYTNGSYQHVTENVVDVDGSRSDASYFYNWDGTYHQIVKDAVAADGSRVDTIFNYNPDGSYQENVTSTAANGQQLNQNNYTVSLTGSYSDSWASQDGSHGTYGWDALTADYHAAWYDSNGTYWTDDYQYGSGGSPQTAGASFVETYNSSDGSHGTRQYDASTGLANISWDSSATGQVSGSSQTAAGFVGLQNDGELTNTQSDLTFFNPAASPAFSAFLASVGPHV